MAHLINKYCIICGSRVDESDGTYCTKHSSYENRPNTFSNHCTWCGRTLDENDSESECKYCIRQAEDAIEQMYELDQRYKRDSRDHEITRALCRICGLYTIHKVAYTDNSIPARLLNVNIVGYEDGIVCMRCGNVIKSDD